MGVRVADDHDVELACVGQRAKPERLVADRIQQRKHLNQPRAETAGSADLAGQR
jgi:hypothetical protein